MFISCCEVSIYIYIYITRSIYIYISYKKSIYIYIYPQTFYVCYIQQGTVFFTQIGKTITAKRQVRSENVLKNFIRSSKFRLSKLQLCKSSPVKLANLQLCIFAQGTYIGSPVKVKGDPVITLVKAKLVSNSLLALWKKSALYIKCIFI